jgi:hypothetical protein
MTTARQRSLGVRSSITADAAAQRGLAELEALASARTSKS